MIKSNRNERGFTLILSLILLIIVAGLVVSAMNTSKTNLQITANMQVQREMENVGQRAIETVLAPVGGIYTYLQTPPTAPFTFHASGDSGMTGDDYSATVTIQCLYKGGVTGDDYSGGIKADSAIMTIYNIRAVVTDPNRSGGKVVINQGVRIPSDLNCS